MARVAVNSKKFLLEFVVGIRYSIANKQYIDRRILTRAARTRNKFEVGQPLKAQQPGSLLNMAVAHTAGTHNPQPITYNPALWSCNWNRVAGASDRA